jgi:hypothetical protein
VNQNGLEKIMQIMKNNINPMPKNGLPLSKKPLMNNLSKTFSENHLLKNKKLNSTTEISMKKKEKNSVKIGSTHLIKHKPLNSMKKITQS